MIFIFAQLPNEIIREIISFIGTYKERNGKLMEQIRKDDPRYDILLTIPRAIYVYEQYVSNENHTYVVNNVGLKSYTTFVYVKKNNYNLGLNILIRVSVIIETHNYFQSPKRSMVTHRMVVCNNTDEKYCIYDHTML